MSMSSGMWIIAGVMMGMMLVAMAGMAWGIVRRRLGRREADRGPDGRER